MPNTTKTFNFATTSEGWSWTTVSGAPSAVYDSGVGNPAGSLQADGESGRNKTGSGYWRYSGTWQSLGVPAGATVTGVSAAGFSRNVSLYSFMDSASFGNPGTGSMHVNGSSVCNQVNITGTVGWTVKSQDNTLTGLSIPAATATTVTVYFQYDNQNDNNAQVQTNIDIVYLTIEYSVASQGISPSGIASTETFGSATASPGQVSVSTSSILTAETFGSVSIDLVTNLLLSSIGSEEAFGSHTLTPGQVTILAQAIASAEAFGSHALTPGQVTILAQAIASEEAFGSLAFALVTSVLPSSIQSVEAFGAVLVTPQEVALLPAGIGSDEVFGSSALSAGPVTVLTQAVISSESFGSAVVTSPSALLYPSGIQSEEAFGTHLFVPQATFILPSSIQSDAEFGLLEFVPGTVYIAPAGVISGEVFGSILIGLSQELLLSGIVSVEAFGDASLLIIQRPTSFRPDVVNVSVALSLERIPGTGSPLEAIKAVPRNTTSGFFST